MVDIRWMPSQYKPPLFVAGASWGATLFAPHGIAAPYILGGVVQQAERIAPTGITGWFGQVQIASSDGHIFAQFTADASWLNKPNYRAVFYVAGASWGKAQVAYAHGLLSEQFGDSKALLVQKIRPTGFDSFAGFSNVVTRFNWQYSNPIWFVDGYWFGEKPYAYRIATADGIWTLPYRAGLLSASWVDGKVSDGLSIGNYNSIVKPRPIFKDEDDIIGDHSIRNTTYQAWVYNAPHSEAFGETLIYNKRQYLKALGWNDSQLANNWHLPIDKQKPPTIYLRNQFLDFNKEELGSEDNADGSRPRGWLSMRFGTSKDGKKSGIPAVVSHSVRRYNITGKAMDAYGKPRISHNPQRLDVPSIERPESMDASNHFIGWPFRISPIGFEATQWLTRIIPENRKIGAIHFDASLFGTPDVALYRRFIEPKGLNDTPLKFGVNEVWNLRQVIEQKNAPSDGTNPPEWSKWQSIANRNRLIRPFGWPSERHGYTYARYGGRVVLETGWDSLVFGKTMIADRIRTFPMEGIAPPDMTYWHAIYNDARVLAAKGWLDGNANSLPHLASNRRYFPWIGGFESLSMGAPMVSEGVRRIKIESRYAIQPPIIKLPEIQNLMQFVTMDRGIDSMQTGIPDAVEKFNIIRTRWSDNIAKVGEPALRKVTPELRGWGWLNEETGMPSIDYHTRYIEPVGASPTVYGRAVLTRRTQTVFVRGFDAFESTIFHRLRKGATPPYSLQYISDANIYSAFGESQVGYPEVGSKIIRRAGGISGQKFGNASVKLNSIRINSGIGILGFGEPEIISKRFVLEPKGIESIWSAMRIGKPRLSPWTIYACVEAPEQAKLNHTGGVGVSKLYGEEFGKPSVENTIRNPIAPKGIVNGSDLFGRASFVSSRQYIEPSGFRRLRFGYPVIPFTPQNISWMEYEGGGDMGKPIVGFEDDTISRIKCLGFIDTAWGKNSVEHFHREILPRNWLSEQMGNMRSGDGPYMWQGLRVGAHVPTSIGMGAESTIWGETLISHRVREVRPIGVDMFASEYESEKFQQRMTVKRWKAEDWQQTYQKQTVLTESWLSGGVGLPDIKNKVHFIRPDGNSLQFRKGAP